jgi:hypothetical protein
MKIYFFRQIFEKVNIEFHQNPSSGSRVVPSGRTDMTKLIAAFRSFANAPKMDKSSFFWDVARRGLLVGFIIKSQAMQGIFDCLIPQDCSERFSRNVGNN